MITRHLTQFAFAAVVGLSMSSVAIQGAAADVTIPEIEWDITLNKFQFDKDKFIGQRFTAKCMPARVNQDVETVYGTDVYPSNNSICTAAQHAGMIDKQGGVVTVQLNPGEASYSGSDRNGVQTADLPGTQRSMVFVGGATANTAADEIHKTYAPRLEWDTKFTATGLAYKQLIGQQFTFFCPTAPGNMLKRRIVGTDTYDFKVIICQAAVHAGKITNDGGLVVVQMGPGQKKLVGSIRNGVETKDGSSVVRTVSFVDMPVVQAQN